MAFQRKVEAVATIRVILKKPAAIVMAQAVAQKALLIHRSFERQWIEKSVAKAHVRQVGLIERSAGDEQNQVIAFGSFATSLASYSAGQQSHLEADLAQHPGEQAVHLVAPPAALGRDQFVEDHCWIKR